jgi:ribosomal protein S18 acetylase RimI-like enzyme
MKVDMELEFVRADGLSHFDMNRICSQVQQFVEQVRINEGLEAAVVRRDNDKFMKLAIWLSSHEAKPVILDNIAKRAARIERGLLKSAVQTQAANAIVLVAKELLGGEFTDEEWKAHKKRHPGAEKSDHTIKKPDEGGQKKEEPKKDAPKKVEVQSDGPKNNVVVNGEEVGWFEFDDVGSIDEDLAWAFEPDDVALSFIQTNKEFRGKGFGGDVLDAAKDKARAQGAENMVLRIDDADTDFDRLEKFYRSRGFKYHEEGDDIMYARL